MAIFSGAKDNEVKEADVKTLVMATDWSATAVGAKDNWPQSLSTTVNILLDTPYPMYMVWGSGHTQFYNDSFRSLLGNTLHEDTIGKDARKTIPQLWAGIDPLIEEAMHGQTVNQKQFRFSFCDDSFSLSCIPVKEESGKTGGVLVSAIRNVTTGAASEDNIKIADSEERLRMAVEGTGVGTFDLNLKTRHIIHSPTLLHIFGHSGDKVLTHGQMRAQIHNEDRTPIVEKAFETALKTGVNYYEARVVWPDGTIHWIRTLGKVVFDAEGRPDRMLGTMMDITPHIAAQKVLKDSEERFRKLLHGVPFAVYTCDATGRIEFYNDACAELWGRQPDMKREYWCGAYKIFNIDGSPILPSEGYTSRAVREKQSLKGEVYIERPNGQRRHVFTNPEPIFDATGNITGVINALVDITDIKKAEEALIESEQRFRTIADTAPVMVWMSNTSKQFYFFNKGWLEFMGNKTIKEAAKWWPKSIHPDDIDRCLGPYFKAFDSREDFYNECRLLRHDGEYRWVSNKGTPRYNVDGEFEGYIGSCVDINDQKLSAEKLEQLIEDRTANLLEANIALERSNEELEQFAFVTSHDLQEPLRKIKTFAHMLYDKNESTLSEEAKSYIDKITHSSQRMSRLINDLLNFSRLSRTKDRFSAVDINEVLLNIRSDFELLINQSNAVIYSDTMPVIEAIPLQMNQLFYNIISNALKFTSPDRKPVINLTCKMLSEIDAHQYPSLKPSLHYCEITISDNGIGFKQEYAQKIFEIFQRLNDKNKYEGTGIGLALCSKIVSNHNGLIFADSEEDKGTDFHIFLPIAQ